MNKEKTDKGCWHQKWSCSEFDDLLYLADISKQVFNYKGNRKSLLQVMCKNVRYSYLVLMSTTDLQKEETIFTYLHNSLRHKL